MAFETFEQDSKIGIRGTGKTLEQSFEEAAKAMFSIMVNVQNVKPTQAIKLVIQIGGLDNSGLFIEWLNRLLGEYRATGLVFSKFKIQTKDDKLIGTAWGEPLSPKKHEAETEVRSATHQMLLVEKKKGKFIAQCLVEI